MGGWSRNKARWAGGPGTRKVHRTGLGEGVCKGKRGAFEGGEVEQHNDARRVEPRHVHKSHSRTTGPCSQGRKRGNVGAEEEEAGEGTREVRRGSVVMQTKPSIRVLEKAGWFPAKYTWGRASITKGSRSL